MVDVMAPRAGRTTDGAIVAQGLVKAYGSPTVIAAGVNNAAASGHPK